MKSLIVAGALVALFATAASASAQNMICADYLKADAELTKQLGANAPPMDAEAAKLDKKMKDYCTKNPSATVDKAMEEATK